MNMLRLFMLDDDPERVSYFIELVNKEVTERCEITVISSSKQWREFKPPYDMIFLDYDLGGRQLTEHPDNGATFVRTVKTLLLGVSCPVVLHSYSPDGARAMRDLLLDLPVQVQLAPFGSATFNQMVRKLNSF